MTRRSWIFIPLVLAAAACGDVTAPDARTPESAVPRATASYGWDIVAQSTIPAYETCGHYATYNGSGVGSVDWAVNGGVVELGASGINVTNNGWPYTVSVGVYSGGFFYEYYGETFYPQGTGYACLQV